MHRILALGATAAFSSALLAQSPAAAEPFTYANGDLSAVGVAGSGWDAAEGGWQVGNSTTGRRFTVTGNACYYLGDGVNQLPTWQPRTLAAPVSTSTSHAVVVSFNLIRNETQPGRGIGVTLTSGAQRLLLIGKEINGPVGLHESYVNSATYASFSTSGPIEPITAVMTYDGIDTSIVLSDSDEVLPAHTIPGVVTFDVVELFGYHKLTVSNGVDDLKVAVTPAAATVNGAGCDGLTLVATGSTPWVGNADFGFNVVGVQQVVAFVGLGSGFLPTGFPLDSIGMPGCTGYTGLDLGLFVASPAAPGGVGTLPFPIPSNPALAGSQFAAQGVALSGATALGLSASNGVDLTIGL
ncbi:MAG: hypothetical protein VYA51_13685 [Planctomycetota bacterium]|nr:hypothetical protein [Planctomycetota bacterium]MEC9049057.1 hypothetical protein [Planctomycetota bacterium]